MCIQIKGTTVLRQLHCHIPYLYAFEKCQAIYYSLLHKDFKVFHASVLSSVLVQKNNIELTLEFNMNKVKSQNT